MRRAVCAVLVVVGLLTMMTAIASAENRPILSINGIRR